MKKILTHSIKFIPFILLLIVFSATDAQAGWFSEIVDGVKGKIKDLVVSSLGIDTSDNCTPPGLAHDGCLFCPMFKVIFNAGSFVAAKAYSLFSSDLGALVIIFTGVSLALITLRNVASYNPTDPGALLNDLLKKTILGVVIYLILVKNYYPVLNLTIVPIFADALNFVGVRGTCAEASYGIQGYTNFALPIVGDVTIGGGLPHAVGAYIVCAVQSIESKIYTIFDFANWGWCRGTGPDRLFLIIPNPIHLIDGAMLYVAGISFMVAYPWVMGDAVLQLGIAFAIAPFAIAGFAFSGTKQYLSKILEWILNALFVFIFMAILLQCILGYIENMFIAMLINSSGDPEIVFTHPNDGIAFFGSNMLKIVFILIIGWAYMPIIPQLADQFAKGAGLTASAALGGVVQGLLEEKASETTSAVLDAAGNASIHVGKVTDRYIRTGLRNSAMVGINTFGHSNSYGGKTVSFMGTKYQTQRNADGSQVLRREIKNPINGRKHVIVSDKYSRIHQIYDKNGNLVKSTVTFNHSFVNKHLLLKNGKINVGAIDKLMNSSLGKNPEYRQAIMSQLAVNVARANGNDISTNFSERHVRFDPNDPYNILIEQKDYKGKYTTISMKINPQTGQVASSCLRERGRNRFERAIPALNKSRKKATRKAKAYTVAKMVQKFGHQNLDGSYSFKRWDGTVFTEKRDAQGNVYYIKEGRRNGLFGPKVTKIYTQNGTEVRMSTAKQKKQFLKETASINKKLTSSSKSVANNMGGLTYVKGKNKYMSAIDPTTGQTIYVHEKKKRKGVTEKVTYYPDKVITQTIDKKGKIVNTNVQYIGDVNTFLKDVNNNVTERILANQGTSYYITENRKFWLFGSKTKTIHTIGGTNVQIISAQRKKDLLDEQAAMKLMFNNMPASQLINGAWTYNKDAKNSYYAVTDPTTGQITHYVHEKKKKNKVVERVTHYSDRVVTETLKDGKVTGTTVQITGDAYSVLQNTYGVAMAQSMAPAVVPTFSDIRVGTKKQNKKANKAAQNIQQTVLSAGSAATLNSDGYLEYKTDKHTYLYKNDPTTGETTCIHEQAKKNGNKVRTIYYQDSVVTETVDEFGTVLDSKLVITGNVTNFMSNLTPEMAARITGSSSSSNMSELTSTFQSGEAPSQYYMQFNNNALHYRIAGEFLNGRLRDDQSKSFNETVLFQFAEHIMTGHDSIISQASDAESNQVVNADGTTASDVDLSELLFGADEMAGVDEMGGKSTTDFILQDIMGYGRSKRTNNVKVNLDWNLGGSFITDTKGNIIGKLNDDGSTSAYYGADISSVSNGKAYDSNGQEIGQVLSNFV